MAAISTFEDFLASQSYQVPVFGFIINIIIAGILAFILGQVYIKYGSSLSNRRMFSSHFLIVAMTTMFIITVVKSSLALSLGLVGALSIVRFRTAIKEPEELAFLFITIAIGLGLGADQRTITIIAFLVLISVIIIRHKFIIGSNFDQNLHLTVSSHNPEKINLEKIVSIMNKYCKSINLKRFDETNEVLEASFLVVFEDLKNIETLKNELFELSKNLKITLLESQVVY
jgi:uncharacterized membrane protein YhiD involved in acid resistance